MARRRSQQGFSSLFGRYWLPVLVYTAIIATVSAQPNLRGPVEFSNSDKIYHVLEYLGLGFLLARALRATSPQWSPLTAALAATSCGIVVGTSDEFLQSFIPGRVSSAIDLMADTLGVALAQVLYRILVHD